MRFERPGRTVFGPAKPGLVGLAGIAVVSVIGLGGCASEMRGVLSIGYEAESYDPARAERELETCLSLSGVQGLNRTTTSLPPGRSIRFAGDSEELERVEKCLKELTGVRYFGFTRE